MTADSRNHRYAPTALRRLVAPWLIACFSFAIGRLPAAELPDDFFAREIRPILEGHCVKCHAGANAKAGLQLTDRPSLLKGGDSGGAIDLEEIEDSLLLSALNYESYEMPPQGKLPQALIDNVTAWVLAGAPWPDDQAIKVVESEGDSEEPPPRIPPPVNDETKRFWSFQPIVRANVPAVGDPAWSENPIDAFVRTRLDQVGLAPNPPATREALVRRAYYDLIGLPPTLEQVRTFSADKSPDALPRLIGRLLASPHYGEKWGRHWLDLVRFAESNSYERDAAKPNAWRYRDYVINSFNDDKPYDQFVREQLAGDEFPNRSNEQLIATGFYRLGSWDDEPSDPEQARYDDLDDIVSTTAQTFLGLTINCARCHDHKLDPIPQADYYRMLAFFAGVNRYGGPNGGRDEKFSQVDLASVERSAKLVALRDSHRRATEQLRAKIEAMEKEFGLRLPGGERDDFAHEGTRLTLIQKNVPQLYSPEELVNYQQLLRERDALNKSAPSGFEMALAVTEVGTTPDETHVLVRGNPHAHGDRVEAGFPQVLDDPVPQILPPGHGGSSGRRTALADWIASSSHPLTARVMANRIWQYHFGQGLVATPNDFGFQGDPPSHPELLDWLASELIDSGWRVKHLHRVIMNSAAYRMSSMDREDCRAIDPENRAVWRFNTRRLTAEEVRDSILFASGRLQLARGGPSIYPEIPPEVLAGQSRPGEGWGKSTDEEASRRSVYIFVKRSLVEPMIASFDGPDTDFTCPVRFATTQPTQALTTMNGIFVREHAGWLQQRVESLGTDERSTNVRRVLERVWQRAPKEGDIRRGIELIESLHRDESMSPSQAFHAFCVVALNSNEFLYVD